MKATLLKIAAVAGALALVAVYILMQSGKRWFEEVAPALPPKPSSPPRIAGDAPRDLTPPVDPSSGPVFAQPTPTSRKTPATGAPAIASEMPPIELPVQVAPQSKPLDPRMLPATSNAPTNIVAPNPLGTGSAPAPIPTGPASITVPALGGGNTSPKVPPTTTIGVPKIQSGPLTISTQPTTNSGLALPQIGPGAHTSSQPSPFVKTPTLVIPGGTPAPQPPTGPQMQLGTGGPRIGTQSPILPGTPPSGTGSPLGLPK